MLVDDTKYAFQLSAMLMAHKGYEAMTHAVIHYLYSIDEVEYVAVYELFKNAMHDETLIKRFSLAPDEEDQDYHAELALKCAMKSPGGVSKLKVYNDEWVLIDSQERLNPRRMILVKGDIGPSNIAIIEGLDKLYSSKVALFDAEERDALTRLYSRESFQVSLEDLVTFYRGKNFNDQPLKTWAVTVGVDGLEKKSEEYSTHHTKKIMLLLSNILNKSIKYTDTLFRYSEDKFTIILNLYRSRELEPKLEELRKTIESYPFPTGGITVSIGFTMIDPMIPIDLMMEFIDRKSGHLMRNGSNQVKYLNAINEIPLSGETIHIQGL
ncbi:MAG: diguanylate cyclase [Gammaproteobacteria bacterium]|jgi:GGDEF domain-containing protein|nr:diguanylate cyclase [Gammaproteobacteria bacterium]MBT7307629.1 diguanylate cyclase [Gammaproteobacteria bacterium]